MFWVLTIVAFKILFFSQYCEYIGLYTIKYYKYKKITMLLRVLSRYVK
jgi:hypothetical protein